MPVLYPYNYPADFPALVTPAPNSGELAEMIAFESGIVTPLDYINVGITPGLCEIWFDAALSPAEEALLNGVIAAHTGIQINASILGSVTFPGGVEVPITEDASWQVVCGLLTTPSFFADDLAQLIARVIAEYNGDGGELRIVEEVDGEPDVVMSTIVFADSGGGWDKFKLDSGVPPRNGLRNIYRVEARRNGSAALTIRYGVISMLRVIVGS